MFLGFIENLGTYGAVFLIICVLAVCVFEAINGFHDTANAVATVIYTKSLSPTVAVIWSGLWNFLGAMLGGIAVAMSMIKLMPVNDLAGLELNESIAVVLSILIAAIAWNLGTWYFGIPCSSSHTMIGALLGGGYAFYTIHGGAGPNWDKAKDIGMALFTSPFVGFGFAVILMMIVKAFVKSKKIHEEPSKKDAPPMWIRGVLILTCTLVSFFHGNNDGQKGVGLLMVVLMAFLPLHFALNPEMPLSTLKAHVRTVETSLRAESAVNVSMSSAFTGFADKCGKFAARLDTAKAVEKTEIFAIRKEAGSVAKMIEETALKTEGLSKEAKTTLSAELKSIKTTYEFRPFWAILMISICLGIGTMFGWKRIVKTIGEKIGKNHLTYAQGASAEMCAAITIGLNSAYGLPVSTTHILSSAVAGTMVAKGGVKNLQKKTIRTIALAWLLTLPVTFVLSFLLYFLLRMIL